MSITGKNDFKIKDSFKLQEVFEVISWLNNIRWEENHDSINYFSLRQMV
jgi:hypothetical protein